MIELITSHIIAFMVGLAIGVYWVIFARLHEKVKELNKRREIWNQ